MDYKQFLGETVINCKTGAIGRLTKVDDKGYFTIFHPREVQKVTNYMFDPFIAEEYRFENPDVQKEIDNEIKAIEKEALDFIASKNTNVEEDIKYIISLDNPDGSFEIIHKLDSTLDEAHAIFSFEEKKQQKAMRTARNNNITFNWRVIRLFDYKTKELLRKES